MSTQTPDELSRVDSLLVEAETVRGSDPERALRMVEAAASEIAGRPEVRLARADLTWELRGAAAARPLFEALIEEEPDYADARHLLGCVFEELGDQPGKVGQFLEVLKLDEALDEELEGYDERELSSLIVETVKGTLEELPSPFHERLATIPILVESRPSEHLVEAGFDPRSLGLFEGSSALDQDNADASTLPTRIVLYSANLLAESMDEEQLKEEIETTILHEVGHFFGLEEEDLARIGLD